jgi:hypothetical protein
MALPNNLVEGKTMVKSNRIGLNWILGTAIAAILLIPAGGTAKPEASFAKAEAKPEASFAKAEAKPEASFAKAEAKPEASFAKAEAKPEASFA